MRVVKEQVDWIFTLPTGKTLTIAGYNITDDEGEFLEAAIQNEIERRKSLNSWWQKVIGK
jgi:hypothetical protein